MDEVRRKGFWAFELFSWMFGIFGGLALVLGSAGVYGVLSYAVSQRTQELGIRIALGASTRDVLALTVGQGLRLVGCGRRRRRRGSRRPSRGSSARCSTT